MRWEALRAAPPCPERVSRTPSTPAGVRSFVHLQYQGYAKNASPWLISLHRSAVLRPLCGATGRVVHFMLLFCFISSVAFAQGRGQAPTTARAAAPVDFTGYWVSVVTEDWRWRMVTPARGDFAGVPLNVEGRKLGEAWDPAKDEAAGEQCKAYGAGGIMRIPGRLHITWEDDNTLRIDTDQGMQTRLFHFNTKAPETGERTWQGYSLANWERPPRGTGTPAPGLGAVRTGTQGRSLEVVTNQLRPGYLRKNGAPYGANAIVREFYDLSKERNGDTWFVVTTVVEDPTYLNEPFVTSTNFKKQADATGWNPVPCSAR